MDLKSLGKFEQGALISGVVAFVVSLFSAYVRVSVDGGDDIPGFNVSAGTNAWTSFATLGMLLILVATALVAVKAFAKDVLPAGIPWTLIALVAAAVGTVLLILRAFTVGDSGLSGVSVGPGWSGYVLFIASIALTVFVALLFKESGEKIPEINRDKPAA